MLVISHHRTRPSWRMLLAVALLSNLVRHCESMSIKTLTDSSSSSSPTLSRNSAESRSQNLGSPSELAWQAWLLLDSQPGAHSGFDSASFLRRITPKSVFIAPALPALPPCADGYRADTMGRCVKNVNIDHEAHLGFLLQRLNNRYGNRGGNSEAQSSNNNQKKSSGPLQLNIPLLSAIDSKSTQVNHEETRYSIKIPVLTPPRQVVGPKEEKLSSETLVTTYERKNSSKTGQDESSGEVSAISSENDDRNVTTKLGTVMVPVAGFVDDMNETSFSEVVDYKISIDPKTSAKTTNVSDDRDSWKNGSQFLNSTDITPPGQVVGPKEEKLSSETLGTTYERKNSSKTGQDESSGDVSAISSEKDDRNIRTKLDTVVVPVAEFVDDVNETSFSGVVDYKISIDPKTSAKTTNVSDDRDSWKDGSQFSNSTDLTPPGQVVSPKEEKQSSETLGTTYERKNSSKTGQDESSGDVSAISSEKGDRNITTKLGTVVVPVAEFVDDMNETSFSGVVDYKISIDPKTSAKTTNVSDDQDSWKNGSQFSNSTDPTPPRQVVGPKEEKLSSETLVTTYERKNSSKTEQDESSGDVTAIFSEKDDRNIRTKLGTVVVPVAEFVDDVNETSFSGVVDYKVSIDPKTSAKTTNVSNDRDSWKDGSQFSNSIDLTPPRQVVGPKEEKLSSETLVTTYERKNSSKTEQDESSGDVSAISSENDDRNIRTKLGTVVVAVAEFIDDVNETSFSGMVDPKISIDPKTSAKTTNVSDDRDSWKDGSQFFNSTDLTPPRQVVGPKEEKLSSETLVTTYERKNSSKKGQHESSGDVSAISSEKDDRNIKTKLDTVVVPVAELVFDVNETSFSGMVDYKISIDSKTSAKTTNVSDDRDSWKDGSQFFNSTDLTLPRQVVGPKEEKLSSETLATTYERKNSSKTEQDESSGDVSAISSKKDDRNIWTKLGTVVIPVAEFVDDVNETSFSGMVDPKISIDPKTSAKTTNVSDDRDSWKDGSQFFNSTDLTPPRQVVGPKEEKLSSETLLTTYERKNSSKTGQDESSGDVSAISSEKDDRNVKTKLDTVVVPVAEFVDDVNEASFSGVVDYKISIDPKTSAKTTNVSDDRDSWKNESQFLNSTEASPMLILLS